MTIRIKLSYQEDEEKARILRVLSPELTGVKIKENRSKTPFKLLYIDAKITARNSLNP